jgi:hypothetical protein
VLSSFLPMIWSAWAQMICVRVTGTSLCELCLECVRRKAHMLRLHPGPVMVSYIVTRSTTERVDSDQLFILCDGYTRNDHTACSFISLYC